MFTTNSHGDKNRHPLSMMAILPRVRHLLAGALLVVHSTALPALETRDEDAECRASLDAYSSSSYAAEEEYTVKVITTSSYNYQAAEPDTTTLCDGRPRVLSHLVGTTETYDPPMTETIYSRYDEPTPTCTIASSACQDSDCEAYTPCTAGIPDYCFVYGGQFNTVYYWPVTTTSGDFCAQNGSTIFAEPTSPPEPNTAVVDGHTFTSPTNYMSFGDAYGMLHGERRQRTRCGTRVHHDVVVPLTETLYSKRWGSDDTYSVNFADFNTVPADAFAGQRHCRFEGACSTIEGPYTAILALPTEVRNLDQEWIDAGCRGTATGYYMTPVALATPTPTAENRLL